MAEKKKTKYFCEGCGSEVAPNAKFCPKCGKFFAAVRCPKCGHIGTVRKFMNGCPSCHYAFSQDELYGRPKSSSLDGEKHSLSRKSKKSIRKAFGIDAGSFFGDVPAWLFATSIVALIALFTALFMRCNG